MVNIWDWRSLLVNVTIFGEVVLSSITISTYCSVSQLIRQGWSKKYPSQLDVVVVHTFNISNGELEADGALWAQVKPGWYTVSSRADRAT